MTEAIQLAQQGTGHASPNPLVGCVIVKNGEVIGRGWHERYGGPHAEANAISDARKRAPESTEHPTAGATAYVSLEPCAHYGKTPPCVDALINAKVATVVIATRDPNPKAAGGIEKLQAAGIEVITGIEAEAAQHQNRAFLHRLRTGRPWVIAKTATSLDGKIATRTGHSQWITGDAARRRAHDLRQIADTIVVGANTLRQDNPSLTVRDRWSTSLMALEPVHPTRVVVTRKGGLPHSARALNGSLPGTTIVATSDLMSAEEEAELTSLGNEVLRLPADADGRVSMRALLEALSRRSQCLVVEGGAELLGAFADEQLIDEVWSFIAPMIIGGSTALTSVAGSGCASLTEGLHLTGIDVQTLGDDVLLRGIVDTSKQGVTDVPRSTG